MEKASSLIAENRRYLRAWMRDWEKRVPTDPDPGSIAGERGAVARPMSEVPGETCDLTVASRMPWLIHPSQELVGAGVVPDDPGTAA